MDTSAEVRTPWFQNVDVLFPIFQYFVQSIAFDQVQEVAAILRAPRWVRREVESNDPQRLLTLGKHLLFSTYTLASVSSIWRHVCVNSPSLWSYICLPYFGSHHSTLRTYNTAAYKNVHRALSYSPAQIHIAVVLLEGPPADLFYTRSYNRPHPFWTVWDDIQQSQPTLRSFTLVETERSVSWSPPLLPSPVSYLDIDGHRFSMWMYEPDSPFRHCNSITLTMTEGDAFLYPFPRSSDVTPPFTFTTITDFDIIIPTFRSIYSPTGFAANRECWLNSVFDILPSMDTLESLSFTLCSTEHFRMGRWRRLYPRPHHILSDCVLPLLRRIRFAGVDTNNPFFGIYMPFLKLRSLREATFQEPLHADFGLHLQHMGMLTSLEIALSPHDHDLILTSDAIDRLRNLEYLSVLAYNRLCKSDLVDQLADPSLLPVLTSLRFRYMPLTDRNGHWIWKDDDRVADSIVRVMERRQHTLQKVVAEVNGRLDGGPAIETRVIRTGVESSFVIHCGHLGSTYSFVTKGRVSPPFIT